MTSRINRKTTNFIYDDKTKFLKGVDGILASSVYPLFRGKKVILIKNDDGTVSYKEKNYKIKNCGGRMAAILIFLISLPIIGPAMLLKVVNQENKAKIREFKVIKLEQEQRTRLRHAQTQYRKVKRREEAKNARKEGKLDHRARERLKVIKKNIGLEEEDDREKKISGNDKAGSLRRGLFGNAERGSESLRSTQGSGEEEGAILMELGNPHSVQVVAVAPAQNEQIAEGGLEDVALSVSDLWQGERASVDRIEMEEIPDEMEGSSSVVEDNDDMISEPDEKFPVQPQFEEFQMREKDGVVFFSNNPKDPKPGQKPEPKTDTTFWQKIWG